MTSDAIRSETPRRRVVQMVSGYAILGSVMVLSMPLGNLAPYLALVAMLVCLSAGIDRQTVGPRLTHRLVVLPAIAFLLLAIAFAFSAADLGEYIFILDFLVLLLPLPLILAFDRIGPRDGTEVIAVLGFCGAISAVLVGLFDIFVLGKPRANGFENSPIHFADLAVIFGFMALANFLAGSREKMWLLVGPFLGLVAALLAGTRGALLVAGVLAGVFVLFFILHRPGSVRAKLLALAGALGLTIAALLLGHALGFTRPYETLVVALEVLSGSAVSDPSTSHRFEFYSAGIRSFLDAPVFGHGWHHQIASALPYMSPEAQEAFTLENWGYIHNEPLGFAVSGGILGLVAYGLWMAAPLVAVKRIPADRQSTGRRYLVLCLVLGFFVAGMTDVLFMSELPKTVFVVVMCAVLVLCRDRRIGREANS